MYQVYVVDGLAFGNAEPSPLIAYEGLAQVVYDPLKHPVRDLLPDLVALPQQNVTFGPPFDIFNDPVPPGSTCHQSEIDEDHAHTCLRFDQVLGNIGKGALDIRFSQPTGVPPVGPPRRQRADRDRQQSLVLHRHDQHRSRLLAQRAFGADAYPAPNCLEPESTSGGLDHFKQGMSVGWTDEYNWFLPGQYVEVTGVPDGDYILDTTVDPTNRLIESDRTNNCGAVRIRLSQVATANPQAELLGPGPACVVR